MDARFIPAQSPFPVGASKKVLRFPSNTLAIVLPLLFQLPVVPMTAPVSWVLAGAARVVTESAPLGVEGVVPMTASTV